MSVLCACAYVSMHVCKICSLFDCFVESAIQKQDVCPITMEPLKKGSIGCLPCGHLFDKDALLSALIISKKCPTCRQACSEEDVQG